MEAVILAAGQGTRLKPLTDDKPKCMVPLAGVSLLEHQLFALRQAGITDISVITGYHADKIPKTNLRHFHNPDYGTTNMVASLFCAEPLMTGKQDLLICYGDLVYEADVIRKLMADTSAVAITYDKEWRRYWELRFENPLDDAESLILDTEGYILSLGKKTDRYEDIQGQYMGLIKVRADHIQSFCQAYHQLAEQAPRKIKNLYMTAFLQYLIDSGWPVHAVMVNNGWLEVDSVSDLELYEHLYNTGKLSLFCNLAEIIPST